MTEINDKDITNSALYECLCPQIRKMAHQMEQKFRLYDGERGDPFVPSTFEFLDFRFTHEWDEFISALWQTFCLDAGIGDGKKPSEVWKEAADCCNFITMIAVNYERQWNEEHGVSK